MEKRRCVSNPHINSSHELVAHRFFEPLPNLLQRLLASTILKPNIIERKLRFFLLTWRS